MDARLSEVFYRAWKMHPQVYSQVFNVRSTRKRQEEDFHLAGVGIWPESSEGAPVEYEDLTAGEVVTYIPGVYKRGMQATREAIDDELYDVFDEVAADLGDAGAATVEMHAADVLNNGFTVNGYDGVPLFDDEHPLPKGHTLSNLASGPLTDENLENALLIGRRHTNNAGLKIALRYRNLIVPIDLEFTALRLTQSELRPGSDENDINVHRGRYKVIVWDYLTSPTAWFIQDPSAHKLKFFWRVRPEFKRMTDFDTDIHKWRGYARFVAGYSAPQGIVGSPGTEENGG